MTKRILTLALVFAFSFVNTVQAQVPPSVLQNQNRIQQEQQRLMNEEFRRQELKNALKRPQAANAEKKSQEKEPDLVTSCVNTKLCTEKYFKKIEQSGIHPFPIDSNYIIEIIEKNQVWKILLVELNF